MNTITLALPDNYMEELKEKADRLGVSPEELVLASIEELLAQPEEEFTSWVRAYLVKRP